MTIPATETSAPSLETPQADKVADGNDLEQGQANISVVKNGNDKENKHNDDDDDDALLTKTCRICLEADRQNDLMAPCRCKGSSKWVHRACLDQWRAYNANDLAFSECMECRFPYQFQQQASTMGRKQHLRRLLYCFLVSRDVVVVTVLVQAVILFFALLFWLAARNEEGVVEWTGSEPYQEPVCVSSGCQFWSCYAVGLLIFFLCLGIYGSFLLCSNDCSIRAAVYAGGGGSSGTMVRGNGNHHRGRAYYHAGTSYGDVGCCNCDGCGAGGCEGEGGMFCLALLLVVGVVLTVIGFVLAAIVAVLVVQMIVRRHFWILQKRSLAVDYRVRDLSADPAALLEASTPSSPRPDGNSSQQQNKLEKIETDRLIKLGLMADRN